MSKTVQRTLGNIKGTGQSSTASSASISKEVTEVVERLVFKEAQSQIEDVLRSASIGSLGQLVSSTGTRQSAVRRINTIVTDVVKQIVVEAERNGVVENAVRQQVGAEVSQEPSETVLTNEQKNTIVQRLQAKGVRRQIAERLLESSGPSQQDVLSSVKAIMSVSENPSLKGTRAPSPSSTQSIDGQIDSKSVLSKSILPTIAGEQFSERIIADVVNEIASYADRETLVENSAGQQQLMNSLERTVSKLVSQTRNARTPDFDWVDAVAQNQDVDVEGQDGAVAESTPSPWFTRVEEVRNKKVVRCNRCNRRLLAY